MRLFTDEYLVSRGVESDYLMHYGVPGMKWGHRKGTYSVGGLYNRARARGDARNEKRWNTELARDSAKAASRAKIAKQLDSKGHKKLASAFSKSSKIHKDWTKSDRTMADMYKKSKQSRLKKADAADKAKADKKAQKQAKLDAMTPEQKKAYIRKQRLKRAAIGAGVAAGVGAAAYAYHRHKKNMGERSSSQEKALRVMFDNSWAKTNTKYDQYNNMYNLRNVHHDHTWFKDNRGRSVKVTNVANQRSYLRSSDRDRKVQSDLGDIRRGIESMNADRRGRNTEYRVGDFVFTREQSGRKRRR